MQAVRPRFLRPPARLIKIALAFLLAMGLIPLSLCSPPTRRAFAADQVHLEIGGQIPYAGYSTARMTANGAPAICAQPSKLTPPAGAYARQDLMIGYVGNPEWREAERGHLRALLYFGPGSYGFDPAIWPSTWYDGSPMTYDRYLVCLHIMISTRYSYDFNKATYGCDDDFKEWALYNLTGQLTETETVPGFDDTTTGKIYANGWRVPAAFSAYAIATGPGNQIVLSFDNVGRIALQKESAEPSLTQDNGCYRLGGASYRITDASGLPVATLVTDDDGRAASGDLAPGVYRVQEVTPPDGYALDPVVYSVTVMPGQTTAVGTGGLVFDEPCYDPASLWLAKHDADTGAARPQGAGSLAGAEFSFDFYPGHYATAQEARESGAPLRSWTFRTDEDGRVLPDEAHRVAGDELFRNAAGSPVLPLGTLLIEETRAPAGYLPDPTTHVRQITGAGIAQEVSSYRHPVVSEPVIRGGVRVEKRDRETGRPSPLGSANLNASFEIVNANDRPVSVEGVCYDPGQVVKRLTAAGGEAQTGAECLPFGTYRIREVMPGDGYLLTDGAPRTFSIEENGVIVDPFLAKESFKNLVRRGDLDFVKAREGTMDRLAGVPFRLTSQTTGESHILVTDENGFASTAASWNPHTQRTNANDARGPGDYDAAAGIWFGAGTSPDDARGALPFDAYTLEELPCKANAGLVLVTIPDIVIARDSHTVALGTIVDGEPDDATPYLATAASDELDGDKQVIADVEATVVDRVEYAGLDIGGTYRLSGVLVDRTTGEPALVDGQPIAAERVLVPAAKRGTASLTYRFNALKLGSCELVAFERLYDQDGRLVASHEDPDDFGQAVRVIEPSASSLATADGDKVLAADPEASVSDAVSFANLVPGAEYAIRGTLVSRATGAPLAVAESSLVTDTGHGSATVTFAFDASELAAGEELVAFETICRGEEVAASDADIDDEDQTVVVERPSLTTLAVDGADGDKRVVASRRSLVADIVGYEGLVPGREYLLRGSLRLCDEDGGDAGPLRDGDGAPVAAELAFVPEEPSGTVELPLAFDSLALAGRKLVVFEALYRGEVLMAAHEDIADERQAVRVVPSVLTTQALDGADGDRSIEPAGSAAVVDRVIAYDVVPGEPYSVVGLLVDKEAARSLLAADAPPAPAPQAPEDDSADPAAPGSDNGRPGPDAPTPGSLKACATALDACVAHGTARVVAEGPDLEAQVVYDLDATSLAGRDLVALAFLFCGDDLVAAEHDLDCVEQTVTVSDRGEPPGAPAAPGAPRPRSSDEGGAPLAKTGDEAPIAATALVAAVACIAASAAARRAWRR